METKIVIRLLDDDGILLGWGAITATARGDGALWPNESLSGWGEKDGNATIALIHWPDVNAQCRAPMNGIRIYQGTPFMLAWPGPVLRLDNPLDHPPMIPVTIRQPVELSVPTGTVGLRSRNEFGDIK